MIVLHRKHAKINNIDGAGISPLVLHDLSIESIAALELPTDAGTVRLEQIFDVTKLESPTEPTVVIVGDCSDVHSLGAGMSGGTLCVLGSVSDYAARGMTGGTLLIAGDAKDHLASGLVEGQIFLSGNCGSHLASPLPGRKSGVSNGKPCRDRTHFRSVDFPELLEPTNKVHFGLRARSPVSSKHRIPTSLIDESLIAPPFATCQAAKSIKWGS